MLRYCIVLMFYGYMQNAHYFILVFGWVGGRMGGISPFSGFVSPFSCSVSIDFLCINVRVLTMLAASIDGFLLFWQPATS